MVKKITIAVGTLFLLLGVLGFVPAVNIEQDGLPYLFGIFLISIMLSVIFIASGVIGLLAASSERYSRWYLQVFGLLYGAFAILGLLQGDAILGVVAVNTADNILHAIFGIVLLATGFGTPLDSERTLHMTRPTNNKPAM